MSEELETPYDFAGRKGKLIALQANHGVISLTPGKTDSFNSHQWVMSSFDSERDGKGEVDAVKLGGERVHGIRFVKK